MFDIHPDFRTLMEHKAFLSTWCRTFFAHKGEGSFLPETLTRSLLHQPTKKGPFQVMFVGTQQTKEQEKLNTRESRVRARMLRK